MRLAGVLHDIDGVDCTAVRLRIMNNKRKEDSLTLELLEAIEEQSALTQRHLAKRTECQRHR